MRGGGGGGVGEGVEPLAEGRDGLDDFETVRGVLERAFDLICVGWGPESDCLRGRGGSRGLAGH
jgi:hypothetical protein